MHPLGDVDVVARPVGQPAELGLEVAGALVDEDQFVAVDWPEPEWRGLAAAAERDPAVVVVEHQQRLTRRIDLIGRGGEFGDEAVDAGVGTDRAELRRIVAPVEMRRTTGESVAAELVVLEVFEVTMDLSRRATLPVLDERFHWLTPGVSDRERTGVARPAREQCSVVSARLF